MGASADLRHRSGCAVDVICPHRLDRINDREIRSLSLKRGQNVSQVGFRGKLDGTFFQPKSSSAHLNLRG